MKAFGDIMKGPVPFASPRSPVLDVARGAPAADGGTLAAIAQREYDARRHRDTLFGAGLFGEPAWDMLLDLYVQHQRGRPISVQSLCIAAAVPQTTAIRWIRRLADAGLVRRERSNADNRVVHVMLTARGIDRLERHLRARRHAPL